MILPLSSLTAGALKLKRPIPPAPPNSDDDVTADVLGAVAAALKLNDFSPVAKEKPLLVDVSTGLCAWFFAWSAVDEVDVSEVGGLLKLNRLEVGVFCLARGDCCCGCANTCSSIDGVCTTSGTRFVADASSFVGVVSPAPGVAGVRGEGVLVTTGKQVSRHKVEIN